LQYIEHSIIQGTNKKKVNCGRVYSAYILKPVLSERNILPRIDALVRSSGIRGRYKHLVLIILIIHLIVSNVQSTVQLFRTRSTYIVQQAHSSYRI